MFMWSFLYVILASACFAFFGIGMGVVIINFSILARNWPEDRDILGPVIRVIWIAVFLSAFFAIVGLLLLKNI